MILHWLSWVFYFLFENTEIHSFYIFEEKIPTLFLNAFKHIGILRGVKLGLGPTDDKHKIFLIPSIVLIFSFPTIYELELSQIKLLTTKTKKSAFTCLSCIFSTLSFCKYLQLNCHCLQQRLQFHTILRRNSGSEYSYEKKVAVLHDYNRVSSSAAQAVTAKSSLSQEQTQKAKTGKGKVIVTWKSRIRFLAKVCFPNGFKTSWVTFIVNIWNKAKKFLLRLLIDTHMCLGMSTEIKC